MSGLLIAGAGGHGRVVADVAEATGNWSQIAFVDDALAGRGQIDDWPVLGGLADAARYRDDYPEILVAIGDNRARLDWLRRYAAEQLSIATLVHPSAVVSPRATLGAGTVVFPNAVINIGARLGGGCIVNTAAVIEHDCQIGAAVHVSPGASLAGQVVVGDYSWIGAGAAVRQQTLIGAVVVVGAGAAVVSNIIDGQTVVGVPARPLVRGNLGAN